MGFLEIIFVTANESLCIGLGVSDAGFVKQRAREIVCGEEKQRMMEEGGGGRGRTRRHARTKRKSKQVVCARVLEDTLTMYRMHKCGYTQAKLTCLCMLVYVQADP